MATSSELYINALKPYGGSIIQQLAAAYPYQYGDVLQFDTTQFDPNFSVKLMEYYNNKMGLGLTDEQIVSGIKAFGDRSQSKFGTGLAADSNPVAVAAESIERALSLAGKDGEAFWNVASQDLNKGQEMAEQIAKQTREASENQYVNWANAQQDDGLFDKIMNFAPMAAGFINPIFGLVASGAKTLGTGGDFSDLLKNVGLSAAGMGLNGVFNGSDFLGGSGGDFFGEGTAGATVDYGSGAANSLGGAAANAAGGTGMFDDIFDWASDFFGEGTEGATADWLTGNGTEFASQDIVDLFNNAGTEGFNQYGVSLDDLATQLFDQAGTAGFDQYGNEAFGLDWLKSQLPSGTSSDTLAKLGKVLFGSGEAGAGGGLLGGTGTGQGSLLGALLGGLAGSYGGAKQDGTINTTQTPWGPQQPYLLDAWEKAKQASNNPINTQAQSNYQSVLQGPTTNPYLGQDNPYLQKQIDNTNDDVTRAMMPAMNQANKASGSFGNSGVADIYSKNMTDAYSRNANDMRFKDYYAQMQLQKDAVNNTLGFTQGTSNFLAGPAQDYAKTVQGNYGGTKSEPYFTNPASSILGGATLGYNLFGR